MAVFMLDELSGCYTALEEERAALIMGLCPESKCMGPRKLALCPLGTVATLSEHVTPTSNGSCGRSVATQWKEGTFPCLQPSPDSAGTLQEPKDFPGAQGS